MEQTEARLRRWCHEHPGEPFHTGRLSSEWSVPHSSISRAAGALLADGRVDRLHERGRGWYRQLTEQDRTERFRVLQDELVRLVELSGSGSRWKARQLAAEVFSLGKAEGAAVAGSLTEAEQDALARRARWAAVHDSLTQAGLAPEGQRGEAFTLPLAAWERIIEAARAGQEHR